MALRRISMGLTTLTYLLIVWGGIVRRSGSGLGCPDWPLCHGRLIPPADPATLIEYTHRLLAAAVSVVMVVLVIGVWRSTRGAPLLSAHCAPRSAGLLALVLLFAQAVLGGMVVKTELQPWLVAGHLALAFLFFGIVLRVTWYMVPGVPATGDRRPATFLGFLALFALYIQIILGGIVSGHQAGLACPDFPTCQGQWWPAFQGLVGMHMIHRIGAIVTTLVISLFVFVVWNRRPATDACPPEVWRDRRRLQLLLFLLALQIALGIGNVLLGLPLVVDVAHLAIATALFWALVHACLNNCQTTSR